MAKSNKGRKFFATTATAALVASAIVPVASAAQINDFNSISSYAQEAVQDLNDRGVIKGDQKGNFNPKSAITRAEAATILANALELEGSGSTSFTDVNKSAWYYDAIDAAVANGIFQGQGAGKFNPKANLTRSEAAIILVDAFGLEGSADLKEFKDEASVKSWAEEALSIAVANGVMKGDEKGNLKPNASITRQDFALMYYRTEAAEGTEEVSGSVKAINATTVEVTFEDTVTDLAALNFAIEGLTISNKVVKQTDSKTVVLTTSAQTADVEYTVTVNGEAVGKFKGVSAVVPTAIKVGTKSVQGTIGKDVTLKATVTVPDGQSKAGIPVTFNVTAAAPIEGLKNEKLEKVVYTNAEGVAEYTYTRYYEFNDTFVAYATSKSSVVDNGVVYWESTLSVKDVTEGTTLANGAKKVYEINSPANKGKYVFVAFEENNAVTPDKAVTGVKVEGATTYVLNADNGIISTNALYPYSYTTGGKAVTAVKLDANGKANLVVSGSNAAVTPIIYAGTQPTVDAAGNLIVATTTKLPTYTATALQAKASKVTFSVNQVLKLDVKALVANNVAATNKAGLGQGGRDYEITLTKNDGKVAAFSPVKVAVKVPTSPAGLATQGILDAAGNTVTPSTYVDGTDTVYIYNLTTDKDGKAVFTVTNTREDSYVTPIVFTDNSNLSIGKLDKDDLQVVAETVYFKDAATLTAAVLKVTNKDGIAKKDIVGDGVDYAEYTYTLVDQHGKARAIAANTTVTFEVSTNQNDVTVKNAAGVTVGTARPGFPVTVNEVITAGATSKSIKVSSVNVTDVTVAATPSAVGYTLAPISETATFTNAAAYTNPYTGNITDINFAANTLKLDGKGTINYGTATTVFLDQNGDTVSISEFETLVSLGSKVHYKVDANGVITLQVRSALVVSGLPAAQQQQHVDNLLAAAAVGSTVALPALTTNIVINSPKAITVEFNGVTGNVDVNLPAGHVTNKGSITGTATITALSANSFVNDTAGTVAALVINDADGVRIANNNTSPTAIGSILLNAGATQATPVVFEVAAGATLPTIQVAAGIATAFIDAPATATILTSGSTVVKDADGNPVVTETTEGNAQADVDSKAEAITFTFSENVVEGVLVPSVIDGGYSVAVQEIKVNEVKLADDAKITQTEAKQTVTVTLTVKKGDYTSKPVVKSFEIEASTPE